MAKHRTASLFLTPTTPNVLPRQGTRLRRLGSKHRGFLECAGRQNSCDHFNALFLQQLPANSLTAWICMHVCKCMHSQSQVAAVEWSKAFKWSQKTQCTKKGVRSLENLYGSKPQTECTERLHFKVDQFRTQSYKENFSVSLHYVGI